MTGMPPGCRLYRGLGGMVLPDQFWRDFDESQVSLVISAAGPEQQRAAVEALAGRVETRRKAVLDSRHALESKVLRLAWDGAEPGPLAAMDLRVISEPSAAAGGGVRVLVAVPLSKFDFGDDLRAALAAAVSASCGGLEAAIDDVADKPRDFKGGGRPPAPRRVRVCPAGALGPLVSWSR